MRIRELKKIDRYGFGCACVAAGLPPPTLEWRFYPTRKWRFDYAFLDQKIAVEVEGAIWTRGRHTRGSGFLGDMDKYNEAVWLNWRILRFTPQQMPVYAVALVKRMMEVKHDPQ